MPSVLTRSTRVTIEVWLCDIARRCAMRHTQSAPIAARLGTANGELPISATELETHFFRVERGDFLRIGWESVDEFALADRWPSFAFVVGNANCFSGDSSVYSERRISGDRFLDITREELSAQLHVI